MEIKDNLIEMLNEMWGCGGTCPYEVLIDCEECLNRMLIEHNNKIARKTIDEFLDRLIKHPKTNNFDWEYYKEIANQMKGECNGN